MMEIIKTEFVVIVGLWQSFWAWFFSSEALKWASDWFLAAIYHHKKDLRLKLPYLSKVC